MDTRLLTLTDDYLKDILKFSFAHCGLASATSPATLDLCVLLIRSHGLAKLLDFLESGEQEELHLAALAARGYLRDPSRPDRATPPPLRTPPPSIEEAKAEHDRLTEAALAAFDARMQQVTPTYHPGDHVEFQGEVLEISRYQRGNGLTGYWLAHKKEEIFVPIEWEHELRPIV